MPDRVEITDDIRKALNDGLRQRRLNPDTFCPRLTGTGDAISASLLKRWLNGSIRTARAGRLEGVRAALEAIPPRPERTGPECIDLDRPERHGRMWITPQIWQTFRAERRRTNIGPTALLKGRQDVPEGLSPAMITHWLDGKTMRARKTHMVYVLKLWSQRGSVTRLTPEIRARLRSEAKRTGHSWASFLRAMPDKPPGLTAGIMRGWVFSYPKTAPNDLLDWVLERFAAMPDKPPKPPRPPKRKPGRPRKTERPGAEPKASGEGTPTASG